MSQGHPNTVMAPHTLRGRWLLALSVWCLCVPLGAQVIDSPAAIVRLHETVNISRSELRRVASLLERQQGGPLTETQKQALLDAEIDSELIRQDAAQQNIRVTDSELDSSIERQRQSLYPNTTEFQFRSALEQQAGITWDAYRAQIRERLIQEKYIVQVKRDAFSAIRPPTQSGIEAFYDENATRFTNPAIVQIEFLLVETRNIAGDEREKRRAKAQSLYTQATVSVSAFEKVTRDALDDPDYSAGQQLILRSNDVQKELLGESFINEIFALESGQFAPRLLESKLGFHVVRAVERRAPKVLKLDDPVLPGQAITVADQISDLLSSQEQQRVFREAVQEITADLRKKADIRTFSDALQW